MLRPARSVPDIHPAFAADETRLKNVTDFVLTKFLPRVKALARCEAGAKCANPDADSMTFVDSHQAEFANHGICARSNDDPQFVFFPDPNSYNIRELRNFDSYGVKADYSIHPGR